MAFGHAVLAMSGEESLAQVYREIASPKVKNLKRTALIMAVYSLAFTGLSALLVVMLVPDNIRMLPENKDNLLGAMAMYLVGPHLLRLLFRGFIVVVGFLMLARRGEHRHRRLQRRSQSRGRRWRAPRLVPQTSQEIRHHLPEFLTSS